eukprot:1161833-Pelagomonas_calceolata.AAC.23
MRTSGKEARMCLREMWTSSVFVLPWLECGLQRQRQMETSGKEARTYPHLMQTLAWHCMCVTLPGSPCMHVSAQLPASLHRPEALHTAVVAKGTCPHEVHDRAATQTPLIVTCAQKKA